MASVFTKIIEGEIPATFVWDDDRCVAFLTIAPLRPGHTLVVPREEIDHWIDCPPDLVTHLATVAQTIGRAQQRAFSPRRVALVVAGMEVPHTHLHVVPIEQESDLHFEHADHSATSEELEAAAVRLRSALGAESDQGSSS
jgi:diadenosine tetraphosphate (Ap4A) HIT family hydrolase